MKKHIKKKAVLALLLLNLLVMANSMVYAAENQISLALAVKQTIEYKNVTIEQLNKTGTYELTSLTEDTPMPEGSENNVYAFSIKGIDETVKIPIVYTHGGIYQYQLVQTTEEQTDYIYDKTNYKITVYVKNSANGGLVSEVIAENGSGKKCGEITFFNKYQKKDDAQQQDKDSVKTGDEATNLMSLLMLCGLSLMILRVSRIKNRNSREY